MIEVQDIVKRFETNVVLNHVSCDMHDGQVNMIIGQSGSGKTVLMKCLIGLHKIDEGQIWINSANGQSKQEISSMNENTLRAFHREVGMLFQGAALFDSMSVLDNVMFPMRMFGNEVESQKSEEVKSRKSKGKSPLALKSKGKSRKTDLTKCAWKSAHDSVCSV